MLQWNSAWGGEGAWRSEYSAIRGNYSRGFIETMTLILSPGGSFCGRVTKDDEVLRKKKGVQNVLVTLNNWLKLLTNHHKLISTHKCFKIY